MAVLDRARRKQLARGFKLANVPDGKAENVETDGTNPRHVNAVMGPIMEPSDRSGESGVVRFRFGDDDGAKVLGTVDPDGRPAAYRVAGGLQPVVTASLAASISGNLNLRNPGPRALRRRLEMGEALRSETGESRPSGGPTLATPPAWTQLLVGKAHAFVVPAFSSSQHEATRLNAYASGSAPLEKSPVPASGTLFYSKAQRFVKKVYKLSASAGLTDSMSERSVTTLETTRGAEKFHAVSGSYFSNTCFNPAVFTFDVPDYGKIRDLRVWLELVHDVRGGPGAISTGSSNPYGGGGTGDANQYLAHGLQNVQVALRSPNVAFKHAHPLWNDPRTSGYLPRPDAVAAALNPKFERVPELLKSSYLLWAGHAVDRGLGAPLGRQTSSLPDEDLHIMSFATGSAPEAINPQLSIGRMDLLGHPHGRTHACFRIPAYGLMHFRSSSFGIENGLIERGTNVGFGHNVAVGPDDVPNAFYYDGDYANGSGSVKHARSGSTGWTVKIVDPIPTGSARGEDVVLPFVFGKDGRLHALYVVSAWNLSTNSPIPPQVLRYAISSSTGWTTEKIVDSQVFRPISLAVDSIGRPHVAYIDVNSNLDNDLKYAVSSSAGWLVSLVTSSIVDGTNIGKSADIAVSSEGTPSIVFHSDVSPSFEGDYRIFIVESGSSGWNKREIVVGKYPSLKIDSQGRRHIFFGTSVAVVHARSGSFGWSFENVDKSGSFHFDSPLSFAIDENFSDVHFAYASVPTGSGHFRYARRGAYVSGAAYFEYDTDIDMRTIIADSSVVPNPRHVGHLYADVRKGDPGRSTGFGASVFADGRYPSPLSASIAKFKPVVANDFSLFSPVADQVHFLTGANFPWMLDDRIPPGNFKHRAQYPTAVSSSIGKSPPLGWLSGPGGTNDVNEWPTTGTQLGPVDVMPVYPMLDDAYVEKVYDQPSLTSFVSPVSPSRGELLGFRPGLRGTEVHGKWQLMIGVGDQESAGTLLGHQRAGLWFRQARLEFVLDQREKESSFFPSRDRRYERAGYVPQREGKRLVALVSGSAAWDVGVNYVYTQQGPEYGRSVGITDATGSSPDSFAVFVRITGSLATKLTGSRADVYRTFLKNEFGTPYVPLSSGSGVDPSAQTVDPDEARRSRRVFDEVLRPRTLVSPANTLRSFLARTDYARTTASRIADLAAAATGSS